MTTIAKKNATGEELTFADIARSEIERGRYWRYLEATRQEAGDIAYILQQKNGKVDIFLGHQATEESFKQLGQNEPAPQILHLATHGFFYPLPEDFVSNSSASAFKTSGNPMIRSGLIMAGGNHAWKTGKPLQPDMEDGILTAYEVSQVNLSNTELVVLSACETGLGDIEGNEGVYGLQRAFRVAGAKNLIMSLWNVPDEQTQEMMVMFYGYWLNEGMELREAFRKAQQEMRKKYSPHYYWAAFVLIE